MFCNFFPPENCAVYEIMWKHVVESGRLQVIRRMSIACWIPRATYTLSEYVIVITFTLQQWLQKCDSVLHCTYIASLVSVQVFFVRYKWYFLFYLFS